MSLCGDLRALLARKVCELVVHMSMVCGFKDTVRCGDICAWCKIRLYSACRLSEFALRLLIFGCVAMVSYLAGFLEGSLWLWTGHMWCGPWFELGR